MHVALIGTDGLGGGAGSGSARPIGPSIFLCGDSRDAVRRVSELIASCGLEPIDCGPLASARYLERLALLMVRLVRERGWLPTGAAMKLSHA